MNSVAPLNATSKKGAGDRSRITPRSLVLVYEVQLRELFDTFPKSPSKERVKRCFGILDELIPFLGTLSPIISIIKDELYRSVYSKNLTSSDIEPFVERIPYFCTVGKIDEARHEELSKVNESLVELQQKIKFRDHDLQILYKKNMALKQEVSDYELKVSQLEQRIRALDDTAMRNEIEKNETRLYSLSKEEELRREVEKLQTNLAQANHIIEKLTVFKTSYNEDKGGAMEEFEKSKLELNVNSMGMVEYDIFQATRLADQFADLMNLDMDEYESSLTQLKKKKEILMGVMSESEGGETSYKLELHEIVASFRKRMTDLLEEQKLLKTHLSSLRVVHTDYQVDTQTVERSADLALRKYSTVMSVSFDNGETYRPWKGTSYCGKCGDRTVLCPHRLADVQEIKLPNSVTHLKFYRPSLHLRTIYKREQLDGVIDSDDEEEEDSTENNEDEKMQVTKTMKVLWSDFYENRSGVKPKVGRPFPLPRVQALITEVYEARFIYEEERMDKGSIKEDSEVSLSTFIDYFYDFMNNRYQLPEITLKAVHDVFTALTMFEAESMVVTLFVRTLCSMDDISWKYFHLAKKLLTKYEPIGIQKYRQMLAVMYPSRPRELYEQMELEMIAFCKNRLTKESVEDHLLHMLINNIEPNYKYFSFSLHRFDYHDNGFMNYEQFDEALGQILPSASVKLKRTRYKVAEIDTKRDEVPIARLAQVASYIGLHNCFKAGWVPQALIAPDFSGFMETKGESASTSDLSHANTTQKEIDHLIGNDNSQGIDEQAIAQEEMKLQKRLEMEILRAAENGEADDDDD